MVIAVIASFQLCFQAWTPQILPIRRAIHGNKQRQSNLRTAFEQINILMVVWLYPTLNNNKESSMRSNRIGVSIGNLAGKVHSFSHIGTSMGIR